MTIFDFFKQTDTSDSFLIGYYGGGNFGDELLLEIAMNLCKQNGRKNVSVYYSQPKFYNVFHKDFGYGLVSTKLGIIWAMLQSRSVIVGGGGIWGLDFNRNNFLLSVLLFVAKYIFFKKVYLLGIGYYNSTTRFGRIGAWLAGKAADVIIARDRETFENFRKINTRAAFLDKDFAFYLDRIDLSGYKSLKLPADKDTVLISLRRFQKKYSNEYQNLVIELVKANRQKKFILALMEHRDVDPENYELIRRVAERNSNIGFTDCSYNPIEFYKFLKEKRPRLITPQFHTQLVSYLAGNEFLPISYDNKSDQLFEDMDLPYMKVGDLDKEKLTTFIGK